jgi:guanidinopropionase
MNDLNLALVGIPFDSGMTNRPGARMGPREIRGQSRLVGFYNYFRKMSPFVRLRIADVGDVPIHNPYDLEAAAQEIEDFYRRMITAGALLMFEILRLTAGAPLGVGRSGIMRLQWLFTNKRRVL